MTFPIVPDLLSSLFKKPNTNPFPAPQLPPTVTGLLDEVNQGKAELNPPVPAPERLRGKMTYNRETCIGCNLCIKVCPAHAIEAIPAVKKVRFYVSQCIQCGQCTEICPKQCLALSGEFLNASHDRYDRSLIVER
ncbi:MAG TPA: 4Fe-4S binding protein [Kiritimatiellia bacterium]|jgi:ferredoxin|nr:4Fe-4S binding protein [Kiritimatiellia bacterium]OQC59317.1 MAG: NAD(P)H-quinone oxidoreductase subunit I [Verrucomicrobia bacterium ADurb.Bin018]MBP9572835.1 4Fe-4S binding protein [Kiritimatiellia bacterium]HOE00654.1 4Fe-4S binding protein [Kiritimatiellia bacterium]HOE36263.1 4Fe-4S binding protein [Kiritimatiellia bacterium]